MGIWFYTDFGYCDNVPSNLSDIIITDTSRPYYINSIDSDITANLNIYVGTSSVEATNALSNFVGQTIFGTGALLRLQSLSATQKVNNTVLTNFLPGIEIVAPNLFSYYNNNSETKVTVAHLLKLQRVILGRVSSNGLTMTILKVNDDNSLSALWGPYTNDMPFGQFGNTNPGAAFYQFLLCGYKTGDDLTDVNKYSSGYLSIYISRGSGGSDSYSIRYAVPSPSKPNSRMLVALFGNDPTVIPDGEGPTPPIDPDNPYGPGGESGEGGGGGNFDDNSDPIEDSSLPTISASNTGFTRIYNPTLAQVQALAQYLWTDESVIQTIWNHIKQYFEDPMQAIIGFNLVPCVVPNGGTTTFKLMYIDTGVPMTAAANQFVDVDCGTLTLEKYYGSALDYSPYTKVSCFLPYIGTVQLNTDEVMDTTLRIKYRIDICSGSCVAKILVNDNVLYQYSGHCAIPIPFSAADFSSYVSAAIAVAKLAIGGAAGGAIGALESLAKDPSQQTNQVVTTTQVTDTARNPATGRQITMGTRTTVETRESPADQSSTMASFSGLTPSNITNTVGQIMGSKPHVEHSGSFSGNTGYLGVRRPFLIIERPNMCMPAQYQQFNGFPSMITETLSNLKGFTKVQQVQLTGMSATNPEQAEILEFLKSGVII